MNKREAESLLGPEFLEMYEMASESGRERLRSQLSDKETAALDVWCGNTLDEPEPADIPDIGEFVRTRETQHRVSRETAVQHNFERRVPESRYQRVVLDEQHETDALYPMPAMPPDLFMPWYGWAGLIVIVLAAIHLLTGG